MTITPQAFASAALLARDLADKTAAVVADALAERGAATLVLPGGRTPGLYFDRLADQAAAWRNVAVTLTDERWVAAEHADSNERLVRAHLASRVPGVRVVPLYSGHPTPEQGEAACAAALAALPRPFDLVVLGMGDDGHIASLWPGTPGLSQAFVNQTPCQAMRPPAAAQPRMTLTLPTLLQARRIALLITGEKKLRVLDRAQTDGPAEALPVRAILRQTAVPLTVYWAP